MGNDAFTKLPPLILIVDDQRMLRMLLQQAMASEGYEILEATDGAQCLKFCQQAIATPDTVRLPDIILLDALMPVVDGFECCAQLQIQLGDRCPPVLMITMLDDEASVNRAFDAGASDYITKPIHWAVLRQRVRRLLHMRWVMTELKCRIEQERLLKEQLERANQALQRLASLDGLTQIANRRYFDECLRQEWLRLAREQQTLALIMLDVDFFKTYNDTYGHLAGDECLQQIAKILQGSARRPADLAARYGGEEFVVLLPNTSMKGALRVAERIRAVLKEKAIAHSGSTISPIVTLSMGVASCIPHLSTSEIALIAEADQALYQAKLAGRDRVACYDNPADFGKRLPKE